MSPRPSSLGRPAAAYCGSSGTRKVPGIDLVKRSVAHTWWAQPVEGWGAGQLSSIPPAGAAGQQRKPHGSRERKIKMALSQYFSYARDPPMRRAGRCSKGARCAAEADSLPARTTRQLATARWILGRIRLKGKGRKEGLLRKIMDAPGCRSKAAVEARPYLRPAVRTAAQVRSAGAAEQTRALHGKVRSVLRTLHRSLSAAQPFPAREEGRGTVFLGGCRTRPYIPGGRRARAAARRPSPDVQLQVPRHPRVRWRG